MDGEDRAEPLAGGSDQGHGVKRPPLNLFHVEQTGELYRRSHPPPEVGGKVRSFNRIEDEIR